MSIGPMQIVLVILLVVLLFGRGKISAMMGDVAKGINAFKKGMKDGEAEAKASPKEIDGGTVIDGNASSTERKSEAS
ncbi:MAG: twin-arginine translocase TatA/TatE family subunit [Neomegalonema sp.]|nr:twin-arginine translocase TatA/TatE family subunit [Neomegalonema sp.]